VKDITAQKAKANPKSQQRASAPIIDLSAVLDGLPIGMLSDDEDDADRVGSHIPRVGQTLSGLTVTWFPST